MTGRLFTLLQLPSLLLGAATLALCESSFQASLEWAWVRGGGGNEIVVTRGQIWWLSFQFRDAPFQASHWHTSRRPPRFQHLADRSFGGFAMRRYTTPVMRGANVGVPLWAVATVLVAPPLLYALNQRKRARRRSTQFCGRCGYDLRATPRRCPECGSVPAEAKA